MKRLMILGCAAAASLFLMADTASAQCGYGGSNFGGSGFSIGYSNFGPRSSFSIGYNSFPGYGYSVSRGSFRSRGRSSFPPSVYRYRSNYRVGPGVYSQRSRFRW